MTAVIDQKEYLKKYLGLGAKDENKKKKKKKKKQAVIQSKVRVVDDELGIPAISGNGPTAFDDDLDDALTAPDELPQIAGIIDERPPEMRTAEYTNSDKWKRLVANEEESGMKEVEEVGRRVRHDSDASPGRQRVRHDSDASPPRVRHDSDASPPRKKTRHDSDASPPRVRQRHDSDASPPRVRQRQDSDASPPRQRVRHDSDASPPRVRQRHDSDASPPRQRIRHDSDASPPRRGKITMDFPPVKIKEEIVSPEARAKLRKKPSLDEKGRRLTTMDGKRAGLQSKETLRMENEAAQARERNAILNAGDDISGRGASTVVRRDRKEEERRRKREEKAARKAAVAAKYQVWNSGVETAKEKEQKVAQEIYVASKPLARYADDVDLERDLRERERADDPMLEYVKKKKAEKFKEENPNYVERPKYQPPPQPPINRFNIWPGYRWDGVDRSSGFENDFYAKQASRKASEEEAYKWSIEDM